MAITLERLRLWILVAGVVLLLAIASFFAYARYRLHQYAHDLPGKLGLEIQQSTNGFTVSRSHAGHTQFILHAAKAVQYKNGGHLVLHDVSITMFGKDGSRADHIAGSQFDYDQSSGIARADGAVDIELASPVSNANQAGGGPSKAVPGTSSKADHPVRVKTSGLIFNQKTQVATTDQALEFQDGDASGSARGAIYDSANGTLDLANDVVLKTTMDQGDVTVKAQSASFNRALKQLVLIKSLTDYDKEHATSDQSTVYFRQDGSADHLSAQGNVHVVTDDGTDLRASDAFAQMDGQSKLKQIRLNGGVLLVVHTQPGHGGTQSSPDSLQTLHADSNSGILDFGPENRLQHVQLNQAVSVVDQQVGLANDPHGSETREMRAAKLDVSFGPDAEGRSQPKNALATGEALVTVHTIHAASPQQSTTLKGDQLFATLTEGHKLSALRGDGHTYLLQESPGGVSQTSSADTLMVKFVPAGNAAGKLGTVPSVGKTGRAKNGPAATVLGRQGGSQVESAVQQGHAVLAQLQPSTTAGAPPVKTTAMADTITYDGGSGRINLTGGTPRITQGGTGSGTDTQPSSEMTAPTIEFNRLTGDATAAGGVKASYESSTGTQSAPGGSAMHVIADHASLDHSKDETTFYGAPNADARLWQGANAIAAPTIILARTRQLLIAQGPARAVKATFAEGARKTGASASSGSPPAAGKASGGGGVMRITSSALTYSGGERKASFSGGVTGQDATGTLQAASLDVYLAPERAVGAKALPVAKGKTSGQVSGPAGQIEHITATGHVEFQQGQRRATGDKLIYTSDDEHFVLTGTADAPPRVTDPVHGTVTGSSLIFNNRDDSVVVSRGQSATVTDTRTTR